jgi:O-antigen/teichoic acid export membrane protein
MLRDRGRYRPGVVSSSVTTRTPLPEGTAPVGLALLIGGVATYAFFKIGTWAVGGEDAFNPISSLWFATFALAPGFFLPLEQEIGRALSHRRAIGQGGRPVVQRIARLSGILIAAVVLIILALSPIIATNYFDGDWVMLLALIAAFIAYAPAIIARGICSGMGRFHDYAIVIGADGVVRIIMCVGLAVVGVKTAGVYGFSVALAPLVGLGVVWHRGALRTDDGPEAPWSEVTQNLGWLLLGSVFAAMLLNAGPIATTILADPDQKSEVTQFAYGVLLARIPLFLFQAVQAALLPRLSRLAARGEYVEFRSGLRRLLVVVLVVGAVGTLGALVLGSFAIDVVYGADLSGKTLAMLALGSACYMVALSLAQAVIALHGHAYVALGWGIGLVTFFLATWLSSDNLFDRVEIGLLVSSVAAMVTFAVVLRQRLAAGFEPDADSMMDAITETQI